MFATPKPESELSLSPRGVGSGRNIVLVKPDDTDVDQVAYVRVIRAAYFSEELGAFEEVYEDGPYNFALGTPS